MTLGMKYAPWTTAEVDNLNRYQRWGKMHEYTCPNTHGNRVLVVTPEGTSSPRVLVATPAGWICPGCGYTQDWAHEFMLTFTEDRQQLMDRNWEDHDRPSRSGPPVGGDRD